MLVKFIRWKIETIDYWKFINEFAWADTNKHVLFYLTVNSVTAIKF